MRKNLVLVGAPGSGKGTQAAKLVSDLGYEHVSTGDLLRAEIAKGSELGLKVKSVMDAGQLVSDDLVAELLKANLHLGSKNYIFDGYPRNLAQAKTLESILGGSEYQVVYFEIETNSLVERITNRRVTPDGKHIYNLLTKPPKVPGICDVTGEKLVQRKDDTEEVVRNRMKVFHDAIDPMLDYYKKLGKLNKVDAKGRVEEIYKIIRELVD